MTIDPGPHPPQSIAYATPAASIPRRWFSLRTTLLALLVTGFIQIGFLLSFQFKQLFVDFHLKLPVLTQVWLDLGEWWNAEYGWAIAWPLAIAGSIGITLLRRRPLHGNERAKWLLFANLAFLAFNIVLVISAMASYLPMVALMEGISNSGGRK